MMPKAPARILIVAALCIAALIGLVVRESMARSAGVEVLLPMEAVDPRALLSGHYVVIDIRDRLDAGETCPPSTIGGPGWIALAADGQTHRAAGAAPMRADAARHGDLLVRGALFCEPPTAADANGREARPGWVSLDLGVDRYYVAQDQALRIERLLRERNAGEASRVFAIVSIGQDGRARLKGLMVDGERLELSWS